MMKDRFKFRFWNIKEKVIHDDILHFFDYMDCMNDENLIPMQCTGMKDMNGKLIYEGDIVNGSCGGYWGKMIVEYNVAGFVLNKNGKYLNFLEGDNFIEVIGNKFENPELLKECENE